MLFKTEAICLKFVKFRETSIIAQLFTEKYGIQSYIVNGVRSSKGKNKIALFQPLTLLDLVVYHNEKREIQRISEHKNLYFYQTLHHDIRKSSICLFLMEIFLKVLRNESHPDKIYYFIKNELIRFDRLTENISTFHIMFLIQLAKALGFGPAEVKDLVDIQVKSSLIDPKQQIFIKKILAGEEPVITLNQDKQRLLEIILNFYEYNIDNFTQPKSLSVLKEVLHS